MATAPTARATRGLAASLIAPMTGAPMGVLPRKAMAKRAMTRPRMAGSARSCMVAFAVAMNEMLHAPMKNRATRVTADPRRQRHGQDGEAEGDADDASIRADGRLRWATGRPPSTAPVPMAAVKAL